MQNTMCKPCFTNYVFVVSAEFLHNRSAERECELCFELSMQV